MKVIFLDFDGVIYDVRDYSILVNPNCVNIVKKILAETGSKIVVTSS